MADSKDIVVLRLEEAIRIIPPFNGEDDIYQFIDACHLAINAVEAKNVSLLIKLIKIHLNGY